VKKGSKAIKPLDMTVIDEEQNSERDKEANPICINTLRRDAIVPPKNKFQYLIGKKMDLEKRKRQERVKRRYLRRQYSDSDDFDYDSEDDSEEYERWKRQRGMAKKKLKRPPSFDSEEY
jgi:hypothetical protein